MSAASSTGVQTLYNATLDQLCFSMDTKILKHMLKWYPAPIVFEVIWKVRRFILSGKKLCLVKNNIFCFVDSACERRQSGLRVRPH